MNLARSLSLVALSLLMVCSDVSADVTFIAEDFDGNQIGEVIPSGGIVGADEGALPVVADPEDASNMVGQIEFTGAGGEWQSLVNGTAYPVPATTVPGFDELLFSYRIYIPSDGVADLAEFDSFNSLVRLNGTQPDSYPPSTRHFLNDDFAFDQWVEFDDRGFIPDVDNTDGSDITTLFPILSVHDKIPGTGGLLGYIDDIVIGVTESIDPPALACDFDGDGACDLTDIDQLTANLGGASTFDVDSSGVVDAADIEAWLTAASSPENTHLGGAKTFKIGDLNLNGSVDSTDLGLLLNNFGQPSDLYSGGNLNDDGDVNSTDLGLMLNNFNFESASQNVVPEPHSILVLLIGLTGMLRLRRK